MHNESTPPVRAYCCFARWSGPLVLSIVLLAMRVIWGWQFHVAGFGKLNDIAKPIAFFTQLGIPFPTANAWLVACVEGIGGLLLILGLAGRLTGLVLTINMIVAYVTADHDAVVALFREGDVVGFFNATPFPFFLTALLVLAFGPGWFSIDGIIRLARWRKRRATYDIHNEDTQH